MKYKYHYVIKHNGRKIDTAQDLFILSCCLNWLLKFHGLEYSRKITTEKKRISVDEWNYLYN